MVWNDEKVLEIDSGYGYITLWIYLIPLNGTFKNGEKGKFYVLTFYKKNQKKSINQWMVLRT